MPFQKIINKATASEIDTGTDDEKFATAKALLDSKYINELQLQNGGLIYAADAGTTDAYAITLSSAPTTYTTGMVVHFKANTINTGVCTLNVNALGVITIKKQYNVDLADGDIKAGQLCSVIYDGTNFQLLSPISNVASGGVKTIYKTVNETISNSATYQDDNHLFFTAEAGKTYRIVCNLIYSSDAGATPTAFFKMGLTYPIDAIFVAGNCIGQTLTYNNIYYNKGSTNTEVAQGTPTYGAITELISTSIITIVTGGTVTLQWAQFTAVVADTTVYKGSIMTYEEVV